MPGRSYDDAFLKPLVDRIVAGETIAEIMRETGIARGTLSKAIERLAGELPPLRPKTETAADVVRRHIPPQTVLAWPDLHCPFEHPDALAFLKAVKAHFKPTTIVCLGDEIDAMGFSKYPRDPDAPSQGKELEMAIEHLLPFYREFPEVLVCESNHVVRPWKRAFEAGLPESFLPAVARVLRAPDGWRWANSWEVAGVKYIHGDAGCSGFTAHIQYMRKFKQNVVIGHIHSFAGIGYEGPLFGMNAGCLIDQQAICFRYAKNMPIPVNLGCGIIIDGQFPIFVPMRTDASGRWIGHL